MSSFEATSDRLRPSEYRPELSPLSSNGVRGCTEQLSEPGIVPETRGNRVAFGFDVDKIISNKSIIFKSENELKGIANAKRRSYKIKKDSLAIQFEENRRIRQDKIKEGRNSKLNRFRETLPDGIFDIEENIKQLSFEKCERSTIRKESVDMNKLVREANLKNKSMKHQRKKANQATRSVHTESDEKLLDNIDQWYDFVPSHDRPFATGSPLLCNFLPTIGDLIQGTDDMVDNNYLLSAALQRHLDGGNRALFDHNLIKMLKSFICNNDCCFPDMQTYQVFNAKYNELSTENKEIFRQYFEEHPTDDMSAIIHQLSGQPYEPTMIDDRLFTFGDFYAAMTAAYNSYNGTNLMVSEFIVMMQEGALGDFSSTEELPQNVPHTESEEKSLFHGDFHDEKTYYSSKTNLWADVRKALDMALEYPDLKITKTYNDIADDPNYKDLILNHSDCAEDASYQEIVMSSSKVSLTQFKILTCMRYRLNQVRSDILRKNFVTNNKDTNDKLSNDESFSDKFMLKIRKIKEKLAEIVPIEKIAEYSKEIDIILNFFAFLYTVKGAKSARQVSTATYLYLGTFNDFPITDKLAISLIVLMVKKFVSLWQDTVVKTESFSDDLSSFGFMLKSISTSAISASIKDLFVTLNSLRFFPCHISAGITKYLGESKPVDLISMITMLIDSIASLVRAGELYAKGMKFGDILFSKDPINTAMGTAATLISMQDAVYTGLPIDGFMDLRTYISTCQQVLPILEKVIKTGNPFVAGYRKCEKLFNDLNPIYLAKTVTMKSQARIPPICILLHGPPGIGKSTLISWIFRIWADVKKRRFEECHIYHRITSSDFWDMYDPFGHPYIHYSELGNLKKKIVECRGDPAVEELTSIIDSAPRPVNMAECDKKGKIFFLGEIIVIDSNGDDLNTDVLLNNPGAVKRRLIAVVPTVLPQYRKDQSCGIDWKKTHEAEQAEGGLRLNDRYNFDIYQDIQINNVDTYRKFACQEADCDIAYDVLKGMFEQHIIAHSDVLEKKQLDVDVKYGTQEESKQEEIKTESAFALLSSLQCFCILSGANQLLFYCMMFFTNSFHIFRGLWHTNASYYSICFCEFLVNNIPDAYTAWFFASIRILLSLLILFLFGTSISSICLMAVSILSVEGFIRSVVSWKFDTMKREALKNRSSAMNRFRLFYQERILHVGLLVDQHKFEIFSVLIGVPLIMSVLNYFIVSELEKQEKVMINEAQHHTETQGTEFMKPSSGSLAINAIEEAMQAGASTKRIAIKGPYDQWAVKQLLFPISHTGRASDLALSIMQNVRIAFLRFKHNGREIEVKNYIIGLKSNYVLINTHALPQDLDTTFRVEIAMSTNPDNKHFKSCIVGKDFRKDLGNDISLLSLSSIQFKNILNHINSTEFNVMSGFVGREPVVFKRLPVFQEALNERWGKIIVEKPVQYTWQNHGNGKCGLPLVGQITGQGAALIGIHFAGCTDVDGRQFAFGALLDKKQIDEGLIELDSRTNFMPLKSVTEDFSSYLDPVQKSPMRYEDLGNLFYIGYDGKGVLPNCKSKLRKSEISKELQEVFDVVDFTPQQTFVPPLMKPIMSDGEWISPYNVNLRKMAVAKKPLDRKILSEVIDHYVDRLYNGLKVKGRHVLRPLDLNTAINGDHDDSFLRRINASTGAGYGFKGKKDLWIPIVNESDGSVTRQPTEELIKLINKKIDEYMKDESSGSIFGSKLKDEPRLLEKALKGKTRMFFPSSIDLLIISRMVLAPFFTTMVEHGDIFNAAVGINMHSDGDKFFKKFDYFKDQDDCIFDGDYGGFDTSMPFEIGWASASVIYKLAVKCGYNDAALKILSGVLHDNLFPIVEVNGDMFIAEGLMTSGSYGTAEFNCIRNNMLMMYYFAVHPDLTLKDYDINFLKSTYGDDVTGAVKAKISRFFNNVVYAEFCKNVYGMDFTSPTKEENVIPLRKIEQLSFLKRSFPFRADLDKRVAALDMESLYRMLYWTSPSDNISTLDQVISTMNSCLWEMYMHKEESVWKIFKDKLIEITKRKFPDLPENLIVDYDRIHDTLCPTAMPLREGEEVRRVSTKQVAANDLFSFDSAFCD
jgi:hypothetical protein